MAKAKSLPFYHYILFSLPFLVISIVSLGEFFYGNPTFVFLIVGSIFSLSTALVLFSGMMGLGNTWIGVVARGAGQVFVYFPWIFIRRGPSHLLSRQPFRAGAGAAFSFSFLIILGVSSYVFWPRLTSKLPWNKNLTPLEQAWEDRRHVRAMLKYYKRNYGHYPAATQFVQELKRATGISDQIQILYAEMKVKKIDGRPRFVDPWGDPYIYYPYKKWGVFKTYHFSSSNVKLMK